MGSPMTDRPLKRYSTYEEALADLLDAARMRASLKGLTLDEILLAEILMRLRIDDGVIEIG